MMQRFKTVDAYLDSLDEFHDEIARLREIVLAAGLEETVKWGRPCYTHEGQMVVGISAFKEFFALWFYQGALLKDAQNVLINAQEGKTKALRQWRMKTAKEIKPRFIKSYIKEAVTLQEQGKSIKPDRNKPVTVPPQLQEALAQNAKAGKAYAAMTRGKQREYAEYIADAKRDETKAKRLAKIVPMIAAGRGLNDKYR